MHKLVLTAVLLITTFCIAQTPDSIVISGTLKNNTRYAGVRLMGFKPRLHVVAVSDIKGENFRIALPAQTEAGVYRLYYSQAEENRFFDIIINGEKTVAFTLDVNTEKITKPLFANSKDNSNYQDFIETTSTALGKISQLRDFSMFYPSKEDKVYGQVRKSLDVEQKSFFKTRDAFVKKQKGTWAGLLAKNRPIHFPNVDDLAVIQQYSQYENFWKGVDTNSEKLLNTPLYNDMILDYISLYMQLGKRYNDEELEKGFKQAVDTLMERFGGNKTIKIFVLDYLTQGFKEIGQEKILQYLDETYRTADQCENDSDALAFEKRMEAYNALKPGMPAPDVNLGALHLRDIAGDKLIVAFWAGWCPHCMQEMPKLNAEIVNYKGVQIAAISLDEDPQTYQNAAAPLANMMHFCDLKKWEGEAAQKFHIAGTPTFFLLDKNRNIIGKYTTVETLLKELGTKG